MNQQQMFMPQNFASMFQPPPQQNNAAMISHQLFPAMLNQNKQSGPILQPTQQINQPPPQQVIQTNMQQPQRSGFQASFQPVTQPQFGFQPQGFGFQPQGFGFQPQVFQPQGFGFQPQNMGFQPQGFGFQPQGGFQGGFKQPPPFNPYNNFRN